MLATDTDNKNLPIVQKETVYLPTKPGVNWLLVIAVINLCVILYWMYTQGAFDVDKKRIIYDD